MLRNDQPPDGDRERIRYRLFEQAAGMIVLVVFLADLAPFDFVADTQALHKKFLCSCWLAPGWRSLGIASATAQLALTQASRLLAFTVLGFLLTKVHSASGSRRGAILGKSLQEGLILATLIESCQLFRASASFDVPDLLLGVSALFLGVVATIGLDRAVLTKRMRSLRL